MSLLMPPKTSAITGLVILLVGLWLPFFARFLEALKQYKTAIRSARSLRQELAARRGLRVSYARLTGLAFVLLGAVMLIAPLVSHWRDILPKPQSGDHSLVTISIESKPSGSGALPGALPGTPIDSRPPGSPPADYSTAIMVVALLLAGATLLFLGAQSRRFVPACAGSLLLLTGLTSSIKNEFKLDKLFGIEKVELNWPADRPQPIHPVFEPIGAVGHFATGCGELLGTHCKLPQTLDYTFKGNTTHDFNELFSAVCSQDDTFFIVGYTDRVPLSPALRRRFESNVGLAQSRAESTKDAILRHCALSGPEKPFLFTLVGGPRDTSEVPDKANPTQLGQDLDRNVGIVWLHDAALDQTRSGPPTPQSSSRRWLVVILVVILILAVFMAWGATRPGENHKTDEN